MWCRAASVQPKYSSSDENTPDQWESRGIKLLLPCRVQAFHQLWPAAKVLPWIHLD